MYSFPSPTFLKEREIMNIAYLYTFSPFRKGEPAAQRDSPLADGGGGRGADSAPRPPPSGGQHLARDGHRWECYKGQGTGG
jgi:hypothetical protein